MDAERHNGWATYETWLVNLWLDNEQSSHLYWTEYANEALKRHDDVDDAIHDIADELKREFEESIPELHGMWVDLINAALADVDWREIATHFCER